MSLMLIDVTRLADRMLKGRLPTGVDRVSLAYVSHFGEQAQAMVRFAGRWVELGKADSRRVFAALLGESSQPRLTIRQCVGRSYALSWRKRRDAVLFNTGHSGLDDPAYAAGITRRDLRAVCFLHDLIPVTHPEYCRPGEAEKHHRRLSTMLRHGRAIVMNSEATRDDLLMYARQHGYTVPPHVVAPLAPGQLPQPDAGRPLAEPYFVVLGTIEPRKNHLLLLNLWRQLVQDLGPKAPKLVVIGQRGWECEQVLDMLDRCPALPGVVLEKTANSDAELATWLYHAQALLFPSFAEGFGIPLIEALMLGVPVIASDLPVFHEIAGDLPEYLDPMDGPAWREMVLEYSHVNSVLARNQRTRMVGYEPPTWKQHFVHVEALLQELRRYS